MSSSGILRHQARTWYTHIHAGMTLKHIKKKSKYVKEPTSPPRADSSGFFAYGLWKTVTNEQQQVLGPELGGKTFRADFILMLVVQPNSIAPSPVRT